MKKIPKHTTSPLPWKLKTHQTFGGTLVVEVVDANGEVVDAILDVNGNPINIGDNTDEVIGKLKKTREIKRFD